VRLEAFVHVIHRVLGVAVAACVAGAPVVTHAGGATVAVIPPVQTGTQAGTQASTQTGTQTGTRSGTQAGTHSGTQAGTHSGTQAGTRSGTHTGTQTGTQTGMPPPAQDPTFRETVVVSASKTEQQLVDAPATMTVIGTAQLSLAPSSSYGDLLRNVPGLNITQISARDINITSRSATSSLATSQLAVVDGRSLYQDFFGFTMWDFMPANLDEIKRIEIIRGPASAVRGANALNGVVNVITKTPREMAGSTATVGFGGFDHASGAAGASGSGRRWPQAANRTL
jgi:outer membrane receptor protein involved in Fe transport